jgi:hypothetical protein
MGDFPALGTMRAVGGCFVEAFRPLTGRSSFKNHKTGRKPRATRGIMETGIRYYQLASRDLVYMKFILEAYEGLSTMSTVDGKKGIVRVSYPAPFADDMAALMEALAKEIVVNQVTEEGEPCSNP